MLSTFTKKLKKLVRKIADFKNNVLENIKEYKIRKSWLPSNKIAEYRKKIKIYDAFMFFNELDLLEIRLNILDEYVDYFILVEATETFSGQPKILYFEENKNRFKKWEHKIIHYVIKDTPKDEEDLRDRLLMNTLNRLEKQTIEYTLSSNTVGMNTNTWLKEFYQKESIKKALVGLNDNDICYVSDLDEIWNPELVIDYTKDDIFKPRQIAYVYYLNNRSDEHWRGWTGTMITKYKNIKDSCLCDLLKNGSSKQIGLKNGGWHFTFQGGVEGAKKKIKMYNHLAYNNEETLPNLEKRVTLNQDYKGRDTRLYKDEKKLPKYLLDNKEKYIKLFK